MLSMNRMMTVVSVVAFAATGIGCDKAAPTDGVASASATASATVSAPPPIPSAAPAKPVEKPSHPCPKGSKGEGTFKKPCMATGTSRIADVKWTGKIKKNGPPFRVTSKSDLEMLYGKIVVYFYDKAGKQLMAGEGDKARSYRSCAGRIFAGDVLKPKEKAYFYFSCVKKKHVPEGTATIEAELKMAGFTAKGGKKKADTYWRNAELVPKKRPRGGIK